MTLQEDLAMVRFECSKLREQRALLNRWIAANVVFGIMNGIGALAGWFLR